MSPHRLIALLASAAGLGGAALLWRKSEQTASATAQAVAGGGAFKVHATGYWPSTAKASELKMEGGMNDRKGKPLHTVEDFLAGKSDHVSVSGDPEIFPYGQKILVNWFDKNIVGRVTDTGSHFTGAKKLYRVMGEEPLDFDVLSSSTPVPKKDVVATIVKGDHLDKPGKEIAAGKFKGQEVVVGGLDFLGAEMAVAA